MTIRDSDGDSDSDSDSDSDGGGHLGQPANLQYPPFMLPSGIQLDSPLLLAKAAAIAFPDGAVKASTLMTEHRRGRLVLEKVGGRWFVTLRAILEMRKLCRVVVNRPASGSELELVVRPSSSSSTEAAKSARAAALIKAERRKKPSRAISPSSMSRTSRTATRAASSSPTP